MQENITDRGKSLECSHSTAGYFADVFETDWNSGAYKDEQGDADATPTDYALEIAIVLVVSGIGVWLVRREI